MLALLLCCTFINPVLAASGDDLTDKIISDDKVLGFDKKTDYDFWADLSLDEAFKNAASLPLWQVAILIILLMVVAVVFVVVFVVLWNILKGGKSATNENPVKAAQGIKDAKHTTREFLFQVGEGITGLAVFLFVVFLFK